MSNSLPNQPAGDGLDDLFPQSTTSKAVPATPVSTGKNNPGNIRNSPTTIGDYDTPDAGWNALRSDLSAKIAGRTSHGLDGESTLLDLGKVWAPAGDGNNDPKVWAGNVASKLGVPVTTKIGGYRNRVDDLAQAVSHAEGTSKIPFTKGDGLDDLFGGASVKVAIPAATPTDDGEDEFTRPAEGYRDLSPEVKAQSYQDTVAWMNQHPLSTLPKPPKSTRPTDPMQEPVTAEDAKGDGLDDLFGGVAPEPPKVYSKATLELRAKNLDTLMKFQQRQAAELNAQGRSVSDGNTLGPPLTGNWTNQDDIDGYNAKLTDHQALTQKVIDQVEAYKQDVNTYNQDLAGKAVDAQAAGKLAVPGLELLGGRRPDNPAEAGATLTQLATRAAQLRKQGKIGDAQKVEAAAEQLRGSLAPTLQLPWETMIKEPGFMAPAMGPVRDSKGKLNIPGWLAEQISQGVGGVASGIEGMAAPLEAGVSDIGRTQLAGMGHPLPGQAALTPELLKQGAKSASETLSGLFQIATPAFAAEFMAAPLKTASGFALFAGVDATTKAALEKAGVPEEYRDLFGQLAGVAAGSIPFMRMGQDAAHKILRDAFPHFWGEAEAGRAEPPPPGTGAGRDDAWEDYQRKERDRPRGGPGSFDAYNDWSQAQFDASKESGESWDQWRRRRPDDWKTFGDWRKTNPPPPGGANSAPPPPRGEYAPPPRNRNAPSVRASFAALGLDETASWEEVRTAYRNLAKEHHPDAGTPNADPEKLLVANAAFKILADDFKLHPRPERAGATPPPRKEQQAPPPRATQPPPPRTEQQAPPQPPPGPQAPPETGGPVEPPPPPRVQPSSPAEPVPPMAGARPGSLKPNPESYFSPTMAGQAGYQPRGPITPGMPGITQDGSQEEPASAKPVESVRDQTPSSGAQVAPSASKPEPAFHELPLDVQHEIGKAAMHAAGVTDPTPEDNAQTAAYLAELARANPETPLRDILRNMGDEPAVAIYDRHVAKAAGLNDTARTAPSTGEGATTKPGEGTQGRTLSQDSALPDKPETHDYSSTQANLPRNISAPLQAFGSSIPKDELGEKGVESESHVTVRYGNPGKDPAPIQKALEGEGPITVTLGKASIFHTDDGDVLKVSVDSPDLHRLNAKVGDAVEHTGETFPKYQPHVTIAYLKKGEGKKYDGNNIPGVTGQQVTLNSVTFSGKDGKQTEIPLTAVKSVNNQTPAPGSEVVPGPVEKQGSVASEPQAASASTPAVPAPAPDGGGADAASTPNAPAPKFPSAKLNPPARSKALAVYRRWFYTPGNVVSGYGGEFDKVLQYEEKPGGTWNVQVVHSDKEGNPLPKEQPRWHATPPDKDYRVVAQAPLISTPAANASESTPATSQNGESRPSNEQESSPEVKPGESAHDETPASAPVVAPSPDNAVLTPGIDNYRTGQKYHQLIPEVRQISPNSLRRMQNGPGSEVDVESASPSTPSIPPEIARDMKFDEPVDVTLFADGTLGISDGHHRVAAAKQTGRTSVPVRLQAVNAKGETIRTLIEESDRIESSLSPAAPAKPLTAAEHNARAAALRAAANGVPAPTAPATATPGAAPPTIGPPSPAAIKSKATAISLRKAADSLTAQIEAKRNPAISQQNVTARRSNIAAGMANEADAMERVQTTLQNLADAHEDGSIPPILADVKSRAAVEELTRGREKFPHPFIHQSSLRDLEKLKGKPGTKAGLDLLHRNSSAANGGAYLTTPEDIKAVEFLLDKADSAHISAGKFVRQELAGAKRMYAAGITPTNWPEARAAIQQYVGKAKSVTPVERQIKDAERALIGRKIPGYFPTPKAVVGQMLEAAEIEPGMSVLEPSAGKGDIADAIRNGEPEAKLVTIEWQNELSKILELKGHQVVGSDFLEHNPARDAVLREDLGVSQEKLDAYNPEAGIQKLGNNWLYTTLQGNDSPLYDSKHEAVEAARQHKELKQQQQENPTRYRDFVSVKARQQLALIKKHMSDEGLSEMEAGSRARKEVPDEIPGTYDRIVMNPPFEDGQDVDHVRHAFDLLKPGGRLVSIMGEHPFFATDKKSVAFREWLEAQGGTSEKLEPGAFLSSERSTGVNARMVVIEKPAERLPVTVHPAYVAAQEESRANREEFHRQQEADEAATATKEPWQQTRDEFLGPYKEPYSVKEIQDAEKSAKGARARHNARTGPMVPPAISGEISGKIARQEATVDEMRLEYRKYTADYKEKGWQHFESVKRAIADGKPVPAKVLAEYPQLQRPAHSSITIEKPEEPNHAAGSDVAAGRQQGSEGSKVSPPDGSAREELKGERTEIRVQGRAPYAAYYAVREVDSVLPSHHPWTFQPNPGYTPLKNDRDYTDKINQARPITNSLPDVFDPAPLVTDNPDAVNGPTMITPEGKSLGGNNRQITLMRAYANPALAKKYRDFLMKKSAQFGIDPKDIERFKKPGLYRVITEAPLDEQRAVTDLNKGPTADLNTAEQALADSRMMTPGLAKYLAAVLENAGPDESLVDVLNTKLGPTIVNRLIRDGIFTDEERPSLIDSETDKVTKFAKDRIAKLVMGSLFEDSDQFKRMAPALRNKLERIAPLLRVIESRPEWSLTPDIRQAANLIEYEAEYKKAYGFDVDSPLAKDQPAMFGDSRPEVSPRAAFLAGFLRGNSATAITKAVRAYVAESAVQSMFETRDPGQEFTKAFGEPKKKGGAPAVPAPGAHGGAPDAASTNKVAPQADFDPATIPETGEGTTTQSDRSPAPRTLSPNSEGPGGMFSRAIPGFYSQLERVIEQKMKGPASPAQLLSMLRNPQSGVKADELAWSGLGTFLEDHKGAVTPQQVKEFLKANNVQVEEEELSAANGVSEGQIDEIEKAVEKATGDWTGMSWQDTTDSGYPYDESDEGKSAGDLEQEIFEYGSHESDDEEPVSMSQARHEAEKIVEQLARVKDAAESAASSGRDAVNLLRKGDIPGAVQSMEEASSLEKEYGDDPIWSTPLKMLRDLDAAGLGPKYPTEWQLPGGKNVRELVLTSPGIEPWGESDAPHYGDVGKGKTIAWARVNDRVGLDGEKILHIEEIQSKRHAEGRKKGYAGDLERSLTPEERELRDFNAQTYIGPEVRTAAQQARAEDLQKRVGASLQEKAQRFRGTVPPAPFSKNFEEVVFKRLLRLAAEQGYAALTWTTGVQQADRYDLSKHLSEIQYEAGHDDDGKPNGKYEISAKDKSGAEVLNEDEIGIDRIEALVGKELAQKIQDGQGEHQNDFESFTLNTGQPDELTMVLRKRGPDDYYWFDKTNQEESDVTGPTAKAARLSAKLSWNSPTWKPSFPEGYREWKSFSGLDLSVGGESHNVLYDQKLPAFANKLAKKWSAKVGTTEVDVAKNPMTVSPVSAGRNTAGGYGGFLVELGGSPITNDDGVVARVFATRLEAESYVKRWQGKEGATVHSLPITDSMRESVMQGQPLFARNPNPIGDRSTSPDSLAQPAAPRTGKSFTLDPSTIERLPDAPSPAGKTATQAEIQSFWEGTATRVTDFNGRPALLVNIPGMEVVLRRMGLSGKDQSSKDVLGITLTPKEWNQIIEAGKQASLNPRSGGFDDALIQLSNQIQKAMGTPQSLEKSPTGPLAHRDSDVVPSPAPPPASAGLSGDGLAERPSRAVNGKASEAANPFSALKPLIVVQASNRIPDNVLKRVAEEESDHALQMELPEGLQGLPLEIVETPAGQKAAASLTPIGYPKLNPQSPFYEHNRALIAAEIGARLMRPGRYRELDLTAQEARGLTEAHIQGLAKHGDKADSIIELLYAALKENPAFEGRTGSVQDHHQAPGARRTEKPRGPPARTGPDVPGNETHGGQAGTPDIASTPGGGSARPGPGEDTGNQPLQARKIVDPNDPKPEINYDARGYFEDLLKPGGNLGQLEKASTPSHTAALRAASARGEANAIMHAVMPAISRTLAGSGFTAEQLRTAYIESRLRGMKQFWTDAADQTRVMSDQQLHDAFKDHFLFLLRAIEDKRAIFHNVAQAAASFVESGGDLINPTTSYMPPAQVARYYEQLRRFLSATFDDAAASVWADGHPDALMSPADFDSILDASRNNPKVRMAHQIYKNDVEQAMRDSHLENEGVLTQNLGPFQTYIPLVPLNRPPQAGGMVAGQPWNPPRNPNNHFATGLSEGYDATLPAFREKLARALRANSRAMLLHTLREAGILQDPVPGQDHIEFQGRMFFAHSVIVKEAGTIIQNGKVTLRPAKMGVLPLAFYKEIEPILENRPMDPDSIKRAIQWVNTIALKGPAEFAMHSTGLMGVLVANTPFLGTSLADKALSLPLIKKVAAIVKVMSEDQDPTTPENAALLRQAAKVGALPSKFATVTYSQKYADETGSEHERWSFTPLLYGPKGIDARARLLMWKIAQAVNPGATAQEMYHFVNQLGNYTPELQSKAEGFFKGTGFGPFFTAGSTRIVNGAGALTGTSPMPGKGWGPRAWQALVSGVGFLALYAAAYHALTGKWPWNDKRFKMLKIPVTAGGSGWIDKYRHSGIGNLLWGKGPETGYIDFGAANPLALRGLRAMGLASALETKIEGGDAPQIAEAVGKDLLNAYLHPTMGPAARLGTVAAFGIEPYVTGVNPPKFMAATPKKLKPGFVGGLAPGLYPHTAERAHAGVGATLGARAAAALGQLNSFYGSLGEATGFLGNEGYSKGNPALRMGLGLASPILPIGAGNASNPFARNEALRRERASR